MSLTITPLDEKPVNTFFKSKKILDLSATIWFVVATLGQWIFLTYVIGFYGKASVQGDFARWNKVLPHGYIEGDWIGNLVMGLHLFFAAIIIFGGPLQIMPQVRRRFPTFHRYLGRTYVFTAVLISLDGLTMVWTRGGVGDMLQHISISIQSIYIIAFAILAIYFAKKRDFTQHRVWALRLFMVCSGVWFFRLGLTLWLLIHQKPVGFDPETFTGPFLTCLSLFTYVFPLSLIVLEVYLRAKRSENKSFHYVSASLVFISTLLTAGGIFAATMILWLPRI